MSAVKFSASTAELHLIGRIADRAVEKLGDMKPRERNAVRRDLMMDLNAVHSNGCRMDFGRLLSTNDFSFWHDINGIVKNIDRETGKLVGGFHPRFSVKEV